MGSHDDEPCGGRYASGSIDACSTLKWYCVRPPPLRAACSRRTPARRIVATAAAAAAASRPCCCSSLPCSSVRLMLVRSGDDPHTFVFAEEGQALTAELTLEQLLDLAEVRAFATSADVYACDHDRDR